MSIIPISAIKGKSKEINIEPMDKKFKGNLRFWTLVGILLEPEIKKHMKKKKND